jgi:hypothetical protein
MPVSADDALDHLLSELRPGRTAEAREATKILSALAGLAGTRMLVEPVIDGYAFTLGNANVRVTVDDAGSFRIYGASRQYAASQPDERPGFHRSAHQVGQLSRRDTPVDALARDLVGALREERRG